MTFNKNELEMKITVLGSFAVGKTSLVRRFVADRFDPQYVNTMGAAIKQKSLMWDGVKIGMNIWDMEDGTDVGRSSCLWGSSAFLVVCDLSRLQTVPIMWSTVRELRLTYPNIPIVVAGNKVDLVNQPHFSLPDDLMASVDGVVLTSAKTGEKVYRLFSLLASKVAVPILISS